MKKFLASLFLMLSAFALSPAVVAEAAKPAAAVRTPKAGVDFDVVAQAIPTDNAAKIEVMEIFWYGCSHCYSMEAPLSAWVKKLPADVYFKRMPGLPRADWAPMAKAFYAMETLGVLEKLHAPFFEAIHKERTVNPGNEKAAIDWITTKSGLDRLKVEQAFKSFTMNSNLNRAQQVFRASGATGVPSLIINGKFITSSTMTGGNEQALKVADYIIDNVRKDKVAAAGKVAPAKK